jgi:hypothetical protein
MTVLTSAKANWGLVWNWVSFGDSAFFPAFPLIWAEPVLRKKEAAGEEGVSGGSGVGNKDTGLAVVHFTKAATVLAGDARRIHVPSLGSRCRQR